MNRNGLYLVIALTTAVTIGLATYVNQLDPRSGVMVTTAATGATQGS